MMDRDLVDFDGLVELAAAVLRDDPDAAAGLRARWPRISVDEYQDIDPAQYELLRLISGDGAGLTAIGDPDQAIYGFRGADVGIFGRFAADFPGASTVELARNYRSNPAIVTAAMQAIAPATLIPGGPRSPPGRDPDRRRRHPGRGGGRARRGGLDRRHDRQAARRHVVQFPRQRPGRRA